jgi:putative membrane protein insertion efficiency factor
LTSGIDQAWGEEDSPSNPLIWVLKAYQEHLSPVDGGRCPSVPTCSSYSLEAFRKHGFFMGWMMTVDRLIHEGKEEAAVSPLLFSEGKWRLYDPVENNDFWWAPLGRTKND